MIDGTYSVMLKTPMGVKKGELVFISDGSVLTGKLIVMGKENPIVITDAADDCFAFQGEIKTAIGKVPYTCKGSISGDSIEGIAVTSKGNMPLNGKRK